MMSTTLKSTDPMHAVRLPPAIPDVPLYRLSASQYRQLFTAGILDQDSSVELVNGWIVMKTSSPLPGHDPATEVPDRPVFRFSVDDYHAMADAEILQSGAPVELLEGWLVEKMTKKPPHEYALSTLWHLIHELVPRTHMVRCQSPITCGTSEPEPDLSIVRGAPRDYLEEHPAPADVALAVEIADQSLKTDRSKKERMYAEAGVVEYWIVNLIDRQIEVYTQPSASKKSPQYGRRQDYAAGAAVPFAIAGQPLGTIAVNEVLP